MDERYTNSIITSTKQCIDNLRYLAEDDQKTLRDIHTLGILNNVYNWTEWYEVSEDDKMKIQKFMDCILLNNSKLTLPIINPSSIYSNTNTPQTLWTYQNLWNNLDVSVFESL